MMKGFTKKSRTKRSIGACLAAVALCAGMLAACGEEQEAPKGLEPMPMDTGGIVSGESEGDTAATPIEVEDEEKTPEDSELPVKTDIDGTSDESNEGSGGAVPIGIRVNEEMPQLYRDFLEGRGSLTVADLFLADYGYSGIQDVVAGTEYTLAELVDYLTKETYQEIFDREYEWDLHYKLLDCGGDGKEELAVKLCNVGIDGPDGGDTTVMIMKEIDGTLYLCFAYDTWSRSDAILNYYGFCSSGGSGGAGLHVYSEYIVDGQGKAMLLGEFEWMFPGWLSRVNSEANAAYSESYGDEYPEDFSLGLYRFDGKEYAVYDVAYSTDTVLRKREEELVQNLIRIYDEYGTQLVD